MRRDYDVLDAVAEPGFRVDTLREAYVAGGFNGVLLKVRRGVRIPDIGFLRDFPGLRYLELQGKVGADVDAFDLPEIEDLTLLTKNQQPLPSALPPTLSSLGIDARPGLGNISGLPSLRDFAMWGWDGPDLRFLSGISGLTALTIEGKNQVLSLQGLERHESLTSVKLVDVGVDSMEPLRRLAGLEQLLIVGSIEVGASAELDLEDITGASGLEQLTLTYGGYIKSVRPLLSLASLSAVRLRGTAVLDGDLSPLHELSAKVRVVGPDD